MTKAKLTPKQELFCREYLIDLNATQAAIRSGYSFNENPPAKKYYTYALVCSLANRVFYIGKGKGARVFSHVKRRMKKSENNAKNEVINKCIDSGFSVKHIILSVHISEKESYSVEESLINCIGFDKLTNVSKAQMSQRASNRDLDLPSIYDFEIISDWAKECLSIIKSKGGKIYFLGVHSNFNQYNVLGILNRAALNHGRVKR